MASDAITEPRRTCSSFLRFVVLPGPSQLLTAYAEATREEMRDARLPIAYRDSCAHLLIPLNKCRRETWYAPWKCTVRWRKIRAGQQPPTRLEGHRLTSDHRTSDIATRSASTSSSRSELPRWTSCGSPRAVHEATKSTHRYGVYIVHILQIGGDGNREFTRSYGKSILCEDHTIRTNFHLGFDSENE